MLVLDISCQHLGDECKLEGFCVPFGHRVGECTFLKMYICIGYILPTIGGYIKYFHGVKLSAVPNSPFWHMVPNCPVPNYSGSKLSVNMGGAKLSWCQIVLGPTVLLVLYKFAIKYENINLKICWMLILNFCQDMDLSEKKIIAADILPRGGWQGTGHWPAARIPAPFLFRS